MCTYTFYDVYSAVACCRWSEARSSSAAARRSDGQQRAIAEADSNSATLTRYTARLSRVHLDPRARAFGLTLEKKCASKEIFALLLAP